MATISSSLDDSTGYFGRPNLGQSERKPSVILTNDTDTEAALGQLPIVNPPDSPPPRVIRNPDIIGEPDRDVGGPASQYDKVLTPQVSMIPAYSHSERKRIVMCAARTAGLNTAINVGNGSVTNGNDAVINGSISFIADNASYFVSKKEGINIAVSAGLYAAWKRIRKEGSPMFNFLIQAASSLGAREFGDPVY